MENEATVQTTEEQVVETVTEQPTEPAAAEQPEAEVTGEKEAEPAAQSRETNARFAEMRRRQEMEQELIHELVGDIPNPDTGKPFTSKSEFLGWKQKQAIAQQAQAANMDPDIYAQILEQAREQVKATDPDYIAAQQRIAELQQHENQITLDSDLKAIKKAFPDEKAKSVVELGTDFIRLCANGVDPVVAYRAVREQKSPAQPGMGDVKPTVKDKGYFTRDEVAVMSQDEIKKHYETIKASMETW